MPPRILGSILWAGNDPVRAREVAKAFASIGVATDITGGVDTVYRVWRLIPPDPSYLKFRNGLLAVRT